MYGLKQLKNKTNMYNIKYKIDGKNYEGKFSFIFITNSSRVAGVDDIYYDIKLDDNMFEVDLANPRTKREILKMMVQATTRDLKKVPGITYYQTNNLEIEFLNKPKTSWCIDGEEYKSNNKKFTFKVDKTSKMLMPKENIKTLFKKQ